MSSADVIDALFDRTVDVVQSLPKAGPIQTSYEEKLALYSLYKQATEGDVASKRPGMLDMLGRAKWDAWSKRQGMDPLDAKQLYVESMIKTLRRFGDRREARQLIEELEAFSGDVAERVMRGALTADETTSETSSVAATPVRRVTREEEEQEDSEDDEDRMATLRGPSRTQVYSTPRASSSLAEHSVLAQTRRGLRPTSSGRTPQQRPSELPVTDEEADETINSEVTSYNAQPTTSRGRFVARETPAQFQRAQMATRYGHPAGPSSVGATRGTPTGMPRTSNSMQGLASAAGQASTGHYGVQGGVRVAPPRSESTAGGNPPYPAAGPSRGQAAIEHHYYHRAPSSAGGRSAGVVGAAAAGQSFRAPAAGRPEVDQALQSIQASLAALHERLNRVESQGLTGKSPAFGTGGRSGSIMGAYRAVWNALQDISALFGLSSGSGSVARPSFSSGSGSGDPSRRLGASQGGPSKAIRVLRSLFSLALSLINLSLRLTLDLTSLGILVTFSLFVIKRVTGRGDPLILLRMVRQLLAKRRATAGAGRVVEAGTVAIAGAAGLTPSRR